MNIVEVTRKQEGGQHVRYWKNIMSVEDLMATTVAKYTAIIMKVSKYK
jgi:hypothetical protein